MARMSERSFSATMVPLREKWDEQGRIRTPVASEPVEPLTEEETVKAENVRMTAAKQKEFAADEKRNQDIETFLVHPDRVAGATVRRADFGVREFTFGGQRAYTYDANAERAERDALAKVNEQKTFAELLTVDMPGKLDVAKRLWAEGGDRAGASAEISAVDSFVKDNYDTLVTLTKYSGRDPLATGIADKARAMVTGSYKAAFSTMDRDPEIKAVVARKRATDMGLSGEAAEAFEKAALGDPWSRTLLDAAGGSPDAAPAPGATGKGPTPQAAKAAAAGIDTASVNGFVKFANSASPVLQSSLGDAFDTMVPADRAAVLKTAYDAGPLAAEAVVNVASKAADGATPQDRANSFRSGVRGASGFMATWGRRDDPAWSALGAKALRGISEIAGGSLSRQPDLLAQTGATIARDLAQYRAMGADIPDDKVPALARVIYARNSGTVSSLSGEDKRMSALLTEAEALKSNVDVSRDPLLDEQAKAAGKQQVETPLGMELMQTTVKGFVHKAAGVSLATGRSLQDTMKAQAAELATDIASMAGLPEETARDAAVLIAGVLAKDGAVDLRSLPEYIRQSVPKPVQDNSLNGLLKTPQGRAEVEATVVQRLGGRASYDSQTFEALRGLTAGKRDRARGPGEFNQFVERVRPVAERIAADTTGDMTWAATLLAGASPADLAPDGAAVSKLGEQFVSRLRKTAPRTVSQMSGEELSALGRDVALRMVDKAALVVPGGYTGSTRRLEELLGGSANATDAVKQALSAASIGAVGVSVGGPPALKVQDYIRDTVASALVGKTAEAALGKMTRTASVLPDVLTSGGSFVLGGFAPMLYAAAEAFGKPTTPYVPENQSDIAIRAQEYALRAFGEPAVAGAPASGFEATAAGAMPITTPVSQVSFPGGPRVSVAAEPAKLPWDTSVPGFELARAVGGIERLRARLEKPIADAAVRQYVREDFYKRAVDSGVPGFEADRMRAQLARGALAKLSLEDLRSAGYAAISDYTKASAEAALAGREKWEKFKAGLKGKEEDMVAEANETSAGQQ